MLFDFHHLKEAKINYINHAVRIFKISIVLIVLGIVGIIHGLFPFTFGETVKNGIKKIANEISLF